MIEPFQSDIDMHIWQTEDLHDFKPQKCSQLHWTMEIYNIFPS